MDASLVTEVWDRLAAGGSLEDLKVPNKNGRIDLRDLKAPEASVVREYVIPSARANEKGNLLDIRGVTWKGMDFSGSRLNSLRFHDVTIQDCSFDGARCQDWRMWGTTISDVSFRKADLRKSALGGVDNGKRNSFRNVDFTKTDLRQTVYKSADFVNCIFADAILRKIDFQGTVFVNCRFEGELREVLFYQTAFRGEAFPPNQLDGVDFSRATLRLCEFRGLDLDRVQFPSSEDHLIISNYKDFLDTLRVALSGDEDVASRKLAAFLGVLRKWAGTHQQKGVINVKDIEELAGREAVTKLLNHYRKTVTEIASQYP